MRLTKSFLLLAVGAAALGGAIRLQQMQFPAQVSLSSPTPVFPGIESRLDSVAKIEIVSGVKTATLVSANGAWGVAERDMYPALRGKLREMLVGLSDLRLIEPRTSDAKLYARLGVEDPKAPATTATLLTLRDAKGGVIAELILGHRRTRTGNLPEAIYVRHPGEEQSWLAEGSLAVDADPLSWIDRALVDIPAAKVTAVAIRRGDSAIDLSRKGDALVVTAPEGAKAEEYKVTEIGRTVEGLTLADVRKGALPGTRLGTAAFTTADGLVVTFDVAKDDKTLWTTIAATGPGADKYQALSGWSFELPDWREASLVPSLADIAPPPPAPKPATPEAPAPGTPVPADPAPADPSQ